MRVFRQLWLGLDPLAEFGAPNQQELRIQKRCGCHCLPHKAHRAPIKPGSFRLGGFHVVVHHGISNKPPGAARERLNVTHGRQQLIAAFADQAAMAPHARN